MKLKSVVNLSMNTNLCRLRGHKTVLLLNKYVDEKPEVVFTLSRASVYVDSRTVVRYRPSRRLPERESHTNASIRYSIRLRQRFT